MDTFPNTFNSSNLFCPEIFHNNHSVFLGIPYYKNKRAMYLSDPSGKDMKISNFLYGLSPYFFFPNIRSFQFMSVQFPTSFFLDSQAEKNVFYAMPSNRYNRSFFLFLLMLHYYRPKFGRSTHVQFLYPHWNLDRHFFIKKGLVPRRYREWGHLKSLHYGFKTRIKRWFIYRDLDSQAILVERRLFGSSYCARRIRALGKGFQHFFPFNLNDYVGRIRRTFPYIRSFESWFDFSRILSKDVAMEYHTYRGIFKKMHNIFEYLSKYGRSFELDPIFEEFFLFATQTLIKIFNYLSSLGSVCRSDLHSSYLDINSNLFGKILFIKFSAFWSYFSNFNPRFSFAQLLQYKFNDFDLSYMFEETFTAVYSLRLNYQSDFYYDLLKKKHIRDLFSPKFLNLHYTSIRICRLQWARRFRPIRSPIHRFNSFKTFYLNF